MYRHQQNLLFILVLSPNFPNYIRIPNAQADILTLLISLLFQLEVDLGNSFNTSYCLLNSSDADAGLWLLVFLEGKDGRGVGAHLCQRSGLQDVCVLGRGKQE